MTTTAMNLFTFFRSGTAHRVRIALALKGLSASHTFVDLRVDEQLEASYAAVNPQKLVPALVVGDQVMIQSPAILEWLDETYPHPPLLPSDPIRRAHVRALAAMVGCDIHPINNRRILQYLRQQFGASEDAINAWCSRWISDGFDAYESMLSRDPERGAFSCGDSPSMADLYLVPQVESARRFNVDLSRWPLISAIDAACMALPAFADAAPLRQADAPQ